MVLKLQAHGTHEMQFHRDLAEICKYPGPALQREELPERMRDKAASFSLRLGSSTTEVTCVYWPYRERRMRLSTYASTRRVS